jgi:hypothetical protein
MENTYEITQVIPEFTTLSGSSDFVIAATFTITGTNPSGDTYKVTRRLQFDQIYPDSEFGRQFLPYKYWGESGLQEALLALCYDKGIIDLLDKNLK